MVLLIWAKFDWSWLSSFTSEALPRKLRWLHCSPHRTSPSIWLSRPIPIMTGSVPKERVEAHKVSWVQALNSHAVTWHILFAKKSHKPGPRSIWRNGLCLFMGKDTKSPVAKGSDLGRGEEWSLFLPQKPDSFYAKKCFFARSLIWTEENCL